MDKNQQALENVAKADAVADLLNHVGWTEVVKPSLLKERNNLSTQLVGMVLGAPPKEASLTKEQVAGFIYGIDKIIAEFEKILKKGEASLEFLESQGFHITANSL